jgi:hypothetical protein
MHMGGRLGEDADVPFLINASLVVVLPGNDPCIDSHLNRLKLVVELVRKRYVVTNLVGIGGAREVGLAVEEGCLGFGVGSHIASVVSFVERGIPESRIPSVH